MRILLLTDIPPCTNYTSGIVINKWCDFILNDNHSLFCALVHNKFIKTHIPYDKKKNITFIRYEKPEESYKLSKIKSINFIKSFKLHWKNINIIIPEIGDSIIDFMNENKIELLMCSIQGEIITFLLDYITKKTGIKYVAQTWDPIEWWIKENNFDIISSKKLVNKFSEVAKNASCFMSMSWEMTKAFQNDYKANCITNIPSLEYEKYKTNKEFNDGKFHIGFSGQVYSKEEFNLLFEVLEDMDWKFNGKDIYLDLFGAQFDENFSKNKNVNNHGYLNQKNLLIELKKMDLLYCPYWFNEEYKKPCLLSFPGKLTTYMKTGVPILMHSPIYASPYKFLKKFDIGYYCNSLKSKDLRNLLSFIIKNNQKYDRKKQVDIFNKYLTYDTMKKCLMVSLGLENKKEIENFEKLN